MQDASFEAIVNFYYMKKQHSSDRPEQPKAVTPAPLAEAPLSRRQFLGKLGKIAAGAVVAGLIGGKLAQNKEVPLPEKTTDPKQSAEKVAPTETMAEQEFRAFPETIPGAIEVKKYPTPHAKFCLVHVLQFHPVAHESKDWSQRVISVQAKIYEIMAYLMDHQNVQKVYLENQPNSEEKEMIEMAKQLTQDDLKEVACLQLERDKGLQIIGAETNFAHKLAGLAESLYAADRDGENPKYSRADPATLFLREIVVLKLVSAQKDPLAVTVYGSSHNWKQDIQFWNQKNPDAQFSLVEVTPEGVSPR